MAVPGARSGREPAAYPRLNSAARPAPPRSGPPSTAAAQGRAAPRETALRGKEKLCRGRRGHTGHTEHTGPAARPVPPLPSGHGRTDPDLPPAAPAGATICPTAAAVLPLCRPKMAAPGGAGAAPLPIAIPIPAPILVPDPPPFPAWLAARLDALGLDRAVYGAYIEGLLREEENDEERLEALRAVLAACLVRGGGPSAAPGPAGSRRLPRADERAVLPPGLPCSPEGHARLRPPWAGGDSGAAG